MTLPTNFGVCFSHKVIIWLQKTWNKHMDYFYETFKGIGHPKLKMYSSIRDEDCLFLHQIWRNSPVDALQWMGAVRMRIQTADKNITIIHTTPVQQLMSCEARSCENKEEQFWRYPFTAEDPPVSNWWNDTLLQICSHEETNSSLDDLSVRTFSKTFIIFLLRGWRKIEV